MPNVGVGHLNDNAPFEIRGRQSFKAWGFTLTACLWMVIRPRETTYSYTRTLKSELVMRPDLHNILSLLTATIIADKHIYASEINVFLKSKGTLDIVQRIDPKTSEAKLLAWYEMNKDEIRSKIVTPYFKDWLYDLLEKLSHLHNKQRILDVMQDIAVADGDVHVSERALISLTQRYWGLN